MLYARFGWNWPCNTEVENFQIFSIYFNYFAIISPWGRVLAFICTNLNSIYSRMLWNLVEIGPVVVKREFLNIFNIISLFRFYLPFEKGLALHLNKFESSPLKDAVCQVWLKLAQWLWRRRFLKKFNIILHFRNYLPLKSLVEIGLVVL